MSQINRIDPHSDHSRLSLLLNNEEQKKMRRECKRLRLLPFLAIDNFDWTYTFCDPEQVGSRPLKFPSNFKVFTNESFRDFVLWFKDFEQEISLGQYTKEEVCNLLMVAFRDVDETLDLSSVVEDDEITNMSLLKIKMAEIIFPHPSMEIVKAMKSLMRVVECSSLLEYLNALKIDCLVYFNSCLCFDDVNLYSEYSITKILKLRLPAQFISQLGSSWRGINRLTVMMQDLYAHIDT